MFEIIPSRHVVIIYPLRGDGEESIEVGFDAYDADLETVSRSQQHANENKSPWLLRWLEIRSILIQQKHIPAFRNP